jgi:hypothetical protein
MNKIQTIFISIIISVAFLQMTEQVFALNVAAPPRCFVDGIVQGVVHKDAAFGVPAYMGLKQDIPEHYELEILVNKVSYVDGESILTCDSIYKKGATKSLILYKDKIKNNRIPVVHQKIAGILYGEVFDSYSLSSVNGFVNTGIIIERMKAFFMSIRSLLKFY